MLSELETDLAQARKIQRDYPVGSPEHVALNEVIANLERALAAFNPKPKGSVKVKRKP
ncbi:MAG: hypothetical protein QXZ68_08025 [Candidatus Bathyarchaeia archaeon]